MRTCIAIACLLAFAAPATAQDELYSFMSFMELGGEMQLAGSALGSVPTPGEFHTGDLPTDGGTVYVLLEGSTGGFLDTPAEDSGGAGAASGAAVGAEAAMADAGAEAAEPAEKNRAFDRVEIWRMDADTNTTWHWVLEGVDAHGRQLDDLHYVVRLTYESAASML